MSKRILKYKLPRDGETVTISAAVVKWLEIHTQNGWPMIWAIVDDEGYPQDYEIIAWGTGWDYPKELDHCQYMGTAVDALGYVWHYFMQSVAFVTVTDMQYNPEEWKLSTTGTPYVEPYSVTISCGDADSAISLSNPGVSIYDTSMTVAKLIETACGTTNKVAVH